MSWERPQRKELTVKTSRPMQRMTCRPYRSPILPKTSDKLIVESWKEINAQEIPAMSVCRFSAPVGREMAKILLAVPVRKLASNKLARRIRLV